MPKKKMTNEEKRLSDEKITAIVDAYNNGTEWERKQAMEDMLNLVQGFIGKIINDYFYNFKGEYYQDLYEEGVLAIIENMGNLDVSKGTPTTYFTRLILHNMSAFINNATNKSTPYYSKMMNQVKEAIKYYEERHIHPSNTDISIHTGLSIKQVIDMTERIAAVNEMRYDVDSDFENDISTSLSVKTPEQEILERERNEALREALSQLDEDDRMAIMLRFGFVDGKEKSYGTIAKEMKLPVNQVTNMVTRAIRIMSKHPVLKQLEGGEISARRRTALNGEMSVMATDNVIRIHTDVDDGEEIVIEGRKRPTVPMDDNDTFIIAI